MSDLLAAVVAAARKSAEERERAAGGRIDRAAADNRSAGGAAFRAALSGPGINVIAECKRRSPSRGVLREIYDPAAIAVGYERGGAAALSVLTEPAFFDGSLDDLEAVRAAVTIPLLRKDFLVTEFQLIEARAAGADAALLIVAVLADADLRRLLRCADSLGLAALVEVHDTAELERALAAGAEIVGVNSRNLRTLEMTPRLLDDLAPRIPAPVVAVAESGLRTSADLRRLRARRYDAFLVGERLMTAPDPGAALAVLLSETSGART